MTGTEAHVLGTLSLPSRYEPLVARLGPEVLNLLMPPSQTTVETLEEAAAAVLSLEEGLFLPIFAPSGTGKTTLAENLTIFLPNSFAPTLTYTGEVSAAALKAALDVFSRDSLSATEDRAIPINIDQREGRPATEEEVSEIKRFLRLEGHQVLVVWPETSKLKSQQMSNAYREIAGVVPLDIPILVEGPPPETWRDLAAQTLQLVNDVDSLEYLVDLDGFVERDFKSVGDYLKRISLDFNKRKLDLERATKKPVDLTILFVTETSGHGILASLTSSRRFGMLDPTALIQSCPESAVGKWWAGHRGLLVQTIVALDAHAFSISPPLSLAVLRRYGPLKTQDALRDLGFAARTPAEITTYLDRSDFGRHLAREQRAVGEARGNPAEDARQVYETYADYIGFSSGRDKVLNAAFGEAVKISGAFTGDDEPIVRAEKAVEFIPSLIPDLSAEFPNEVRCFEFTYRKGDFLQSKFRSTIAQYCLTKLKNYATSLGWVSVTE